MSLSRHNVGLTGDGNFVTNQRGGNNNNSNMRRSGAGGNSGNRVGQLNSFGMGMGVGGIGTMNQLGGLGNNASGGGQHTKHISDLSGVVGAESSFQSKQNLGLGGGGLHSKKHTQQSNSINSNNN